jgi:hypothetical protein
MKTSGSQSGASRGEGTALPVLDVFLLYEDSATGLRAKRSLDLLPGQYKLEPAINTRLWRCDLLAANLLREQAAREAANADVIILSLHGRNELPIHVRQWLSLWLNYKEARPYALGLLLDPDAACQGAANAVSVYVRTAAEAAGAEFFRGFSDLPTTVPAPVVTRPAEPTRPPPVQPD